MLAAASVGAAMAVTAPPVQQGDNCTGSVLPHHTLVYFGATAPNPAISAAARTLYTDAAHSNNPTWFGGSCSQNQETFNADVDTNNDNVLDTCITLYIGTRSGSCEGVRALDQPATFGSN